MPAYGAEHLSVLAITVVLAVALPLLADRQRRAPRLDRALTASGWALLVVAVFWLAWGFLPANWNFAESLPFHFSDGLRIFAAVALITRAPWAVLIAYYWGFTLNLMSLLTPDLNYFVAPALEFTLYWVLHVAVLLVPLVLMVGVGLRPTWRGYALTLTLTCGWAALAMLVNSLTGANYGYLAHAPRGASLLDALGPWPTYLLWELALVAVVWALMTWPFTTRRSLAATEPVGSGRWLRVVSASR
jgi:hypothetical integral membrane protein (TIGR02206 family)